MAIHRIKINLPRAIMIALSTLLLCLSFPHFPRAWAWDSASSGNPTHSTHSYLTEWAINQLESQSHEVQQFRTQLLEGANSELHELETSGTKYDIDLNAKRIEHKGTNEGCDDIEGWWKDSLSAYRNGNKQQAYFLTGIMLHMIEDMGVPAHANKVYHQGNLTEFDNFEYLALSNWKPDFNSINRQDPNFAEPWKYYGFSQEWTHADAPNYRDRNSFSKTWFRASQDEKTLLKNRQARTANVAKWALNSAVKVFNDKSQVSKPTSGQSWVLSTPSFWQWNNQCSVDGKVVKITLLQTGNQLHGTYRTVWNGVWEDTPVSGSISGRDVQISYTRGFTVTFNGKLDQASEVHGVGKGCGGTQADFSMTRDNN